MFHYLDHDTPIITFHYLGHDIFIRMSYSSGEVSFTNFVTIGLIIFHNLGCMIKVFLKLEYSHQLIQILFIYLF